ncbi:MAG TPA: YIP1 family protein [Candidatus Angelobacter sp.]
MSTSVPPISSEAVPASLSEPQRIINTFVAPSKTFADIRRNASWWVPWLLLGIIGLAVGMLVGKKVNWEQVVREQMENGPRASQFESASKEQQDQQVALGVKIGKALVYAAPIFSLIGGLIVAAILMAAFNFGFEASVPYTRSLAIVFYGWLPGIVHALLILLIVLLKPALEGVNLANPVATNLAYFMDKASSSKFLYGMAGAVDVITIWCIVLIGIGFAVNAAPKKLSRGAAISTIVVLFLIYKLALSALGWV